VTSLAVPDARAPTWPPPSPRTPFSPLVPPPPPPGAHLFDDGLTWTECELELNTQDNSVVGIPSVHGGTAYHAKGDAGKDVGADAKV
jgi:hypothetical protein